MVGSPLPVIGLIAAYVYFVRKLGIEFMKDRKPYNLDRIIQIYNAAQVILCGWLTIEVSKNFAYEMVRLY